jgi:hypothetical protein
LLHLVEFFYMNLPMMHGSTSIKFSIGSPNISKLWIFKSDIVYGYNILPWIRVSFEKPIVIKPFLKSLFCSAAWNLNILFTRTRLCHFPCHMNSVHILTSNFFTICFNFIFRLSPPSRFSLISIVSLCSVVLAHVVCVLQDSSVARREARCRCFLVFCERPRSATASCFIA